MSRSGAEKAGGRGSDSAAPRPSSPPAPPAEEEPAWAAGLRARLQEVLVPLVARDGGRCELARLEANEVVLRFTGRCAGCPGFGFTTEQVAEPLLRPLLPEGVALRFERRASIPPRRGGAPPSTAD